MVTEFLLLKMIIIMFGAGISRVFWLHAKGVTPPLSEFIKLTFFPTVVGMGIFMIFKGEIGIIKIKDDLQAYGYASLVGAFGLDIVKSVIKLIPTIIKSLLKLSPEEKEQEKENDGK